MNDFKLITPVAFIIFNRPDTAIQVFECIRKIKPAKLLVIADGPRKDKVGESDKCQQCRDIIKKVDWECEVLTNYSEVNLGCKVRVSSGLDWVFENVEEAIILEDDCLPDLTFFRYCQELLERFRYDNRIMMISGDNFYNEKKRNNNSYFFSRIPYIWGWASWRRAWKMYDVNIKLWPKIKEEKALEDILSEKRYVRFWGHTLDELYKNKIDTWDYQWIFSLFINNGMSIVPCENLVKNIGFSENATHTFDSNSPLADLDIRPMEFPMKYAEKFYYNKKYDNKLMDDYFSKNSLVEKIMRKLNYFKI